MNQPHIAEEAVIAEPQELKVAAVRKSIRTFGDLANDLLRSDWQMFGDGLRQFASFCQTDPVFSKIHDQLANNPNLDGDEWMKQNANVGLSGLHFPVDPDQRLSLQYQLVIAGAANVEGLIHRAMMWFQRPHSNLSDYVHAFADSIMRPLFRDLGYRLEEILERLPSDRLESVSAGALQIIHVESSNVHIGKRGGFEFRGSKNIQVGDRNTQDNRE